MPAEQTPANGSLQRWLDRRRRRNEQARAIRTRVKQQQAANLEGNKGSGRIDGPPGTPFQ
jgi:hypothetical protein